MNEIVGPVICGNHRYGCLAAAQSPPQVPKNRFCFQNLFRETRRAAKRLSLYASLFQWEYKANNCFSQNRQQMHKNKKIKNYLKGLGLISSVKELEDQSLWGKPRSRKRKRDRFWDAKAFPSRGRRRLSVFLLQIELDFFLFVGKSHYSPLSL
jgi:hypothetical protein